MNSRQHSSVGGLYPLQCDSLPVEKSDKALSVKKISDNIKEDYLRKASEKKLHENS